MFGILTAAMEQVDDLPSGLVFALVLLGGWIVIKGAVNWLFAFYTYFVRPGKNMRDFGEWAGTSIIFFPTPSLFIFVLPSPPHCDVACVELTNTNSRDWSF